MVVERVELVVHRGHLALIEVRRNIQLAWLHVALALDRTHIVHASPSAGEVVVAPLDAAWQRRLIAVRRVLKP